MDRVYLWGLPGVGKSKRGQELANELNWGFLDLDTLIEKEMGKSIPEIFEQEGEEKFRELESDVLKNTIFTSKIVVACGGGTPCFFNNAQWMNWNGLTVFLERDLNEIAQSIRAEMGKRPSFKGFAGGGIYQKLEELLRKRTIFYQKAQIIAPTNQQLIELLSTEKE